MGAWMASGALPRIVLLPLMAMAALVQASAVRADGVESFYKGKTVELLIGAAVGGAYIIPGACWLTTWVGIFRDGRPSW